MAACDGTPAALGAAPSCLLRGCCNAADSRLAGPPAAAADLMLAVRTSRSPAGRRPPAAVAWRTYSLRPGGDAGGVLPGRGLSAGAVGDMLVSDCSAAVVSGAAAVLSTGASTRKASRPALKEDWRPGPPSRPLVAKRGDSAGVATGGVSVLSRNRASSRACRMVTMSVSAYVSFARGFSDQRYVKHRS